MARVLRPWSFAAESRRTLQLELVRSEQETVHALEDRCPHRTARLSSGFAYEGSIACAHHGWSIRLVDGCVDAPDCGQVRIFAVRLVGDFVEAALE